MTAPRFQTGGRHLTSPASLWGHHRAWLSLKQYGYKHPLLGMVQFEVTGINIHHGAWLSLKQFGYKHPPLGMVQFEAELGF